MNIYMKIYERNHLNWRKYTRGDFMLNNIREIRTRSNKGLYNLTLEIPEKEFFQVYDDVNKESAYDIIKKYLIYREDDARPRNTEINYNKGKQIICLNSELHYLENDHSSYS